MIVWSLLFELSNIAITFGLLFLFIMVGVKLFVKHLCIRPIVSYFMNVGNMSNPDFDFDKYVKQTDLWA